MGKKRREEPRPSGGAAAAAAPPPPSPLPAEARQALDLYQRYRKTRDERLKEALLELALRTGPSSAGYLAVVKVVLEDSVAPLVLSQRQKVTPEESDALELRLMEYLFFALEAAMAGATKFNSVQCLRVGAHLIRAIAGREMQYKQYKAKLDNHVKRLTVFMSAMWSRNDQTDAWVRPETESIPRLRWPFEAHELNEVNFALYRSEVSKEIEIILNSVEELNFLASVPVSGYNVHLPGGNGKEGLSSDELLCPLQKRLPHCGVFPTELRMAMLRAAGVQFVSNQSDLKRGKPQDEGPAPQRREAPTRERNQALAIEVQTSEAVEAQQKARYEATQEWLMQAVQAAGNDPGSQRAAVLSCLKMSVPEFKLFLQKVQAEDPQMELANLLDDLKFAQQGSLLTYGWPSTMGDYVATPTKEEFMTKCIDSRLTGHTEEAWKEARQDMHPPMTVLLDCLFDLLTPATRTSLSYTENVQIMCTDSLPDAADLAEPGGLCAADIELISSAQSRGLDTESLMKCTLWRSMERQVHPHELEEGTSKSQDPCPLDVFLTTWRNARDRSEAFFIEEEDLMDRLIDHGELECTAPSTSTAVRAAAPTLIKGQLMLQALDCLQQNTAGSSEVQGLREQMLTLSKIDFAKSTLEGLTEGLGLVKGWELGLQRLKETLTACANSCRTSDPGIPELLAPVSFALLPCMLEGSDVMQTTENIFQVKKDLSRLVLLGLAHLKQRKRLMLAVVSPIVNYVQSFPDAAPESKGQNWTAAELLEQSLLQLMKLPLGALLELHATVCIMWGLAFVSFLDVDESLQRCLVSEDQPLGRFTRDYVCVSENGLDDILKVQLPASSSQERLLLSGGELARTVGDFCCAPVGVRISEGDSANSPSAANASPTASDESGHLMEQDDETSEVLQRRRLRTLKRQFKIAQQGQHLSSAVTRIAGLLRYWQSTCENNEQSLLQLRAAMSGEDNQTQTHIDNLKDALSALYDCTIVYKQLESIADLLSLSLDASKVRKQYRSLSNKLESMTRGHIEASKLGTVSLQAAQKKELLQELHNGCLIERERILIETEKIGLALKNMRDARLVLQKQGSGAFHKRDTVGDINLDILIDLDFLRIVDLDQCKGSWDGKSITAASIYKYIDVLAGQFKTLAEKIGNEADDMLIISGEALISGEVVLGQFVEDACIRVPQVTVLTHMLTSYLPWYWEQNLEEERRRSLAQSLLESEEIEQKAESTAGKKKGATNKAKRMKSKQQAARKKGMPVDELPDEMMQTTETGEGGRRVVPSLTVEQEDGYARMLAMLQSTEEGGHQTPGVDSPQSWSQQQRSKPENPSPPPPLRPREMSAAYSSSLREMEEGWSFSGRGPPPSPTAGSSVAVRPGKQQPCRQLAANVKAQIPAGAAISDELAALSVSKPSGEDEAAELQAALQESLALEERLAAYRTAQEADGDQGKAVAAAPGLANAAGEYNCFLNVIVQCLWHCGEFRAMVLSAFPPELAARDPVVSALHRLFNTLARREAEGPWQQPGPAAEAQGPVDAGALREALASLPGREFKTGEMSDAGEVLLAIYGCIKDMETRQNLLPVLDSFFGIAVGEAVHCSACGKGSHQMSYVQYFYNVPATGLRLAGMVEGHSSMGRLLRWVESQQEKSCDTDVGGCGTLNRVNQFLQRPPRVFSMQLAWESGAEDPADIAATMELVNERVDMADIYQAGDPGVLVYALRSMVCYYGSHYFAFVLSPQLGHWLIFDDASVSRVGTWADVVTKCRLGRIQPSVLFYERACVSS